MVGKLREDATVSEPVAQEAFEKCDTKAEKKKKKKKKNRDKDSGCQEENEVSPKRKLQEGTDSEIHKKKKKHKKSKDENVSINASNEKEEAKVDENSTDGSVVVTGKGVKEAGFVPLKSFVEAGLPDAVLECCRTFKSPSPIQSHAWPFLLHGRDFIGIAATGSGKTLAFGVPGIMHVLNKRKGKMPKGRSPLCLVLSPTRELAQQGSTRIGTSWNAIRFIMGTGHCDWNSWTVKGFDGNGGLQTLRSVLCERQMVMFSATWPLQVNQLAQEFMDPDPVKVVVGSEDLAANHDVMQIVEVLDDRSRDNRLVALLEKYHKSQRNRVLVFVLYKNEASRVENMLQRRGWKAVSIHGDKAQTERTKALSLFKSGSSPLMIATDVAARGLDIPDVEVVINYSFPLTTEDYVHRIGRTGRAGKKGVAHTFFMQQNKGLAGELVNVLREAKQVVPDALLKFGTHVKKKESKLYGAHFKEITADAPKSTKITFNDSDED
ncbi:DEAD-box ATP-dependent RNA helicase 5, partial [Cucurbita argyrosperma subsp. sororia]